ncbi:MAG: FtsQ-type POTRA domain-containing protein [Hydrogenoanaerobacterium sp.]
MKKTTEENRTGRGQSQKRHKHRRSRNTAALYIMVLVFMLTVGVVLIFTVFFKVLNINVEGLTRYNEQDVIASSGIAMGENMFALRRSEIEAELVKKYSYFEKVKLVYHLPDTVTIKITEAQPVGAVQQGEMYMVISSAGRVLENTAELPPKVVTVKGFDILPLAVGGTFDEMLLKQQEDFKLAAKLPVEATAQEKEEKKAELIALTAHNKEMEEKVAMMRAFFSSAAETNFIEAEILDVSDKFNLIAVIDKVTIEFGAEAELSYKMQCVQKVFSEKLPKNFEGKLDASYAGRVRVRHLNSEIQGMTTDQYAEYLYEQNSASLMSSADGSSSSVPEQQPKPEVQQQKPEVEKEPPKLQSEASVGDQNANADESSTDDYNWDVVSVE